MLNKFIRGGNRAFATRNSYFIPGKNAQEFDASKLTKEQKDALDFRNSDTAMEYLDKQITSDTARLTKYLGRAYVFKGKQYDTGRPEIDNQREMMDAMKIVKKFMVGL